MPKILPVLLEIVAVVADDIVLVVKSAVVS